jgi:hypothetical protein
MVQFNRAIRLRHWLIRMQWRHWIFPLLCSLPYVGSLLWIILRGQFWIAQVLLAPLFMGLVIALMTFWLAQQEFRTRWRSR